ncbi:hypothetical protein CRV08_04510 [Halarcobacter ebronensis]|uniref:Uncharacterized protein n=1 Tax=Halarcobacter ebronensis TaxID=1462615 RepID=A0A4Q0YFE0_9BACT|nr:cache domain-containing protein [Halarcobacter ebronensis]RXJ69277.1 hypothetical protein CRV08_04510 [Halarcobacter ebronensis]
MKIINRWIFIILIFTALLLSFIFYQLTLVNKTHNLINRLENSLTTTRYLFEEQKRYALSLSILLSEDKEILDSFVKHNRAESFDIVNRKIVLLKKLQNSQIDVQMHNSDLTTYIRSWNFSIKDVPLESFRYGIVKVHKDKKPSVSIELGKRLNIKAISALIKDDKMIGSLEVIIGFDYLENELKQRGLDTFILLQNSYLDIADTLKNNIKIGNFTLVNDKNKEIAALSKVDISKLKDYGYFTSDDKAFSYFSIYSFKREKLAYIIVSLSNKDNISIYNSYEKDRTIRDKGVIIE